MCVLVCFATLYCGGMFSPFFSFYNIPLLGPHLSYYRLLVKNPDGGFLIYHKHALNVVHMDELDNELFGAVWLRMVHHEQLTNEFGNKMLVTFRKYLRIKNIKPFILLKQSCFCSHFCV